MEYLVLQNTRLNLVMRLADVIVSGLTKPLPSPQTECPGGSKPRACPLLCFYIMLRKLPKAPLQVIQNLVGRFPRSINNHRLVRGILHAHYILTHSRDYSSVYPLRCPRLDHNVPFFFQCASDLERPSSTAIIFSSSYVTSPLFFSSPSSRNGYKYP